MRDVSLAAFYLPRAVLREAESVRYYRPVLECTTAFYYHHPFYNNYYTLKWVESLGVVKGVWSVPTFSFEKLATCYTNSLIICAKTYLPLASILSKAVVDDTDFITRKCWKRRAMHCTRVLLFFLCPITCSSDEI